MARARERVKGLTLAQFHRYLDKWGRELKACYKEIEEIQFEFNDVFQRELEAWKETFGRAFPLLTAQRPEMPEAFARQIDQIEVEEQERIREEIATLDVQIVEGRGEMDRLVADAQAAGDALRQANPELNDEEEGLKAQVLRYEDQFVKAFDEQDALESRLFGTVTSLLKIRRLKKTQKKAKKNQAAVLARLRQVRQEWVKKVDEAGETQAGLRGQWQERSIAVSEAQGRRDHLESNFASLAEQAALQRVLEEMSEPPADVDGELGATLEELVERNRVRWGYEEGLKAVAEALGLLKGMGEGLQRFQKSVQTVLQEQRRYSLREVQLILPKSVVAINQIWNALRDKVLDEKYMGRHPLEFSKIVDQYIRDRLDDASIQGFFENMGESLNAATSAWE